MASTRGKRRAASIDHTRRVDAMKEVKTTYETGTYEGAGHGINGVGEPNAPEPTAPRRQGREADDNRKPRETIKKQWSAFKAKS